MTAEPEVYPPEALADDEPRYLRRQRPLEIRRRKFARKSWPAYRRWLVGGAALVMGGWLAYQGSQFLMSSPRVALAGPDQVEIVGLHYVSADAVTGEFAPDFGRSILRIPLDARRAALETIPWVAQASVQRVLPNRIRVEINERVPVAFLRIGNQLALVDAAGVILERPLDSNFTFPVVGGLSESMPLEARAQRMSLFVQFMKEMDLAKPGAGDQVSEVDLSDAHDLRASLTNLLPDGDGQPILVHFGDSSFVNKYRLLLENVGSWRTSAGRLQSGGPAIFRAGGGEFGPRLRSRGPKSLNGIARKSSGSWGCRDKKRYRT